MSDEATHDHELPPSLADQLTVALALDETPATVEEALERVLYRIEQTDVAIDLDSLCVAEETRHQARVGEETLYFHCVLDTLLLPFVLDNSGPIEIRSTSPISGGPIDITVTKDEIDVSPDQAIMSYGVAADIEIVESNTVSALTAYERFCPYVNAFSSRPEYERWDEETPDAVTMGLPIRDAFALVRNWEDEMPSPAAEPQNPGCNELATDDVESECSCRPGSTDGGHERNPLGWFARALHTFRRAVLL